MKDRFAGKRCQMHLALSGVKSVIFWQTAACLRSLVRGGGGLGCRATAGVLNFTKNADS